MAQNYAKSFYSSKQWQDCRNEYAKRTHYLCENCMRKGIYRPGEIVHHKIEINPINIYNPEITLNFDNLEHVCRECHAELHKKRNKGKRYTIDEDGKVVINGQA